jgi:hypothetical protein
MSNSFDSSSGNVAYPYSPNRGYSGSQPKFIRSSSGTHRARFTASRGGGSNEDLVRLHDGSSLKNLEKVPEQQHQQPDAFGVASKAEAILHIEEPYHQDEYSAGHQEPSKQSQESLKAPTVQEPSIISGS